MPKPLKRAVAKAIKTSSGSGPMGPMGSMGLGENERGKDNCRISNSSLAPGGRAFQCYLVFGDALGFSNVFGVVFGF